MTNDLAIKILTGDVLGTTEQTHEAIAMAVKALSARTDTDTVSRQDAIDALHGYFDGMLETDTWSPCDVYGLIEILPSAQPDPIKLHVDHALTKEEIKNLKQKIADSPIVLMPSAQPEPKWIPWNSGKLPEESGTYTVTAYDGATKRVTYAKYQKRLKRWELTGARAYWRVLAWMPLPEPYAERRTDG